MSRGRVGPFVVLAIVAGCSVAHGTVDDAAHESDAPSDARRDSAVLPDARDGGGDARPDLADASSPDGSRDAAYSPREVGCDGPAWPPLGSPCPGPMVVQFGSSTVFRPLGPLHGEYVYAYASGASPPDAPPSMLHISLDLTSIDASRGLEGFPMTVDGYPWGAGPSSVTPGIDVVAVEVGGGSPDGFVLRTALYDTEGRLVAPMVTAPPGLWENGVMHVDCDGVHVLWRRWDGACGNDLHTRTVGFDGSIREDSGPRHVDGATTLLPVWRGGRWLALATSAECGARTIGVVTIAADGTSVLVPLPTGLVGASWRQFVLPEEGPWSSLSTDPATGALTYARFDPDSATVLLAARALPMTAPFPSRIVASREPDGTDAFVWVDVLHTMNTHLMLLRVRSDGSVLQYTDLARGDFQVYSLDWAGDRHSLVVADGAHWMARLVCAP